MRRSLSARPDAESLLVAAVADLLEHRGRFLAPPAERTGEVGRGQLAGAARARRRPGRGARPRAPADGCGSGHLRSTRSCASAPHGPSCSTRWELVSTSRGAATRPPGRRPSSRARSPRGAPARSAGRRRAPSRPPAGPCPPAPSPFAATRAGTSRGATQATARARCLPTQTRPCGGQLVLRAPEKAHLLAPAHERPVGLADRPAALGAAVHLLPERRQDDVGLRAGAARGRRRRRRLLPPPACAPCGLVCRSAHGQAISRPALRPCRRRPARARSSRRPTT